MGQYCGIIIQDSEPGFDNQYAWYKPSTDEWFAPVSGVWTKVADGSVFATITATKVETDALETNALEVDSEPGIDADVVSGTTTMHFKGGILYEVEEA